MGSTGLRKSARRCVRKGSREGRGIFLTAPGILPKKLRRCVTPGRLSVASCCAAGGASGAFAVADSEELMVAGAEACSLASQLLSYLFSFKAASAHHCETMMLVR